MGQDWSRWRGRSLTPHLSGAAQPSLGVWSFCTSLLSRCPAEAGLGLGAAGGLGLGGAGGAGGALVHRCCTHTHIRRSFWLHLHNRHLASCGTRLPSLSPLAVAVVSVESQLSCSAASAGGGGGGGAEPDADMPLLEAGAAPPPGASDSNGLFVHCRAFFCRQKDQLVPRSSQTSRAGETLASR